MTNKTMTLEQVRYEISALNAGGSYIPHGSLSKWAEAIDRHLSQPSEQHPDPNGCNNCTHPDCGRFDGPAQVECRAMQSNACAREQPAERGEAVATRSMPPEREEVVAASLALGGWMAAALDDHAVCAEMKRDINRWFDAAMPSAPPPAAGVPDVRSDAENWGNALNEAAWLFVDVCPEKSTLLFNHAKASLRTAILKYLDLVSATPSPTIDIAAVRTLLECIEGEHGDDHTEADCKYCAAWNKLARAIGDAK